MSGFFFTDPNEEFNMLNNIMPTRVTFCHSSDPVEACVVLSERHEDTLYLVTDVTPFHPVSHIWPDHPADRGEIQAGNEYWQVETCLTGAVEQSSGKLYVAHSIPVKRDTEGWSFVVVHAVSAQAGIKAGMTITLKVDAAYQESLSRGHSAGHIASLALNKVLMQGYWRKEADRKDPHGNADFNSYAQESSSVTPDHCQDIYRLGKTLKKRGLNREEMLRDLAEIEARTNQQIQEWLKQGAEITMRCQGETLTSSRYWECKLEDTITAVIPCGGTHVRSLNAFGSITVTLTPIDEQHIKMCTQTAAY